MALYKYKSLGYKSKWLHLDIYHRAFTNGKVSSRLVWTMNFDHHHYYPPSPKRVLTAQGSIGMINFWFRLGKTHAEA